LLAAERRKLIAGLIHEQTSVHIKELCAHLGVSASTIRRDLAYLERKQVLARTHGGAVIADEERAATWTRSDALPSPEQMRLGAAVGTLIAEGETVFLGAGTDVLAVAYHIVDKSGVTVVTNALNVAAYLTDCSQLSVILTGGQVERQETALLGHVAELALRELRADRAIIGVAGIHLPDGVTGESLPTVQLLRAVIDLVPEVVVLAASSKWGRVGPAFLAPLEAIDVIVTDRNAPPAMVWDLTELGIRIIQA